MFDELQQLRDSKPLGRLLQHYARAGLKNCEAWQDRVMHLPGVEARELVTLHGLLLAYGWLEQNTGKTPRLKPGVAACCYRITDVGMRAMQLASRRQTVRVGQMRRSYISFGNQNGFHPF